MKSLRQIGFLLSVMIWAVILVISSELHNDGAIAQIKLSQRGDITESMSLMEWDTNRDKLDYSGFDLEADEPALCQNACAKDSTCKAWTYVRRNIQGPKPKCWLKNSVPPPSANSCCVSGIKTRSHLFKGALDLATNTLTMSIPVGNGRTQEVRVRANKKGQLIDPSTSEVARSIDLSSIRDSAGLKVLNEIWQSVKENTPSLSKYDDKQRLDFATNAIDMYGKIDDYVIPLIESELKSLPSINPTSIIANSIASGFVTGDFPGYLGLDDLDGLGIRPLFDKINRALADINNR